MYDYLAFALPITLAIPLARSDRKYGLVVVFRTTMKSFSTATTSYFCCGLTFNSDIDLPELTRLSDQSDADVNIRCSEVSEAGLTNASVRRLHFQSAPDELWLDIPRIARFKISEGNLIHYQPYPDADRQSIRLFILGSCLGTILHQRQLLVLHGNAIRFNRHCVVFLGYTGAGKSTLAAAFHKLGHEILADDICAIADRKVQPSYPQLKLWHDSAQALDIDISNLKRIRLQLQKYAYPLTSGFTPNPLPVASIYLLNSWNKEHFDVEELDGFRKFDALRENTYRAEYLHGLGIGSTHLQQCSALANSISIRRISRPNDSFQIDKLVETVITDINSNK